jgi:hypothetical protein
MTKRQAEGVQRALEPRPHRKANQTACETKQAVGTVLGPSPEAQA